MVSNQLGTSNVLGYHWFCRWPHWCPPLPCANLGPPELRSQFWTCNMSTPDLRYQPCIVSYVSFGMMAAHLKFAMLWVLTASACAFIGAPSLPWGPGSSRVEVPSLDLQHANSRGVVTPLQLSSVPLVIMNANGVLAMLWVITGSSCELTGAPPCHLQDGISRVEASCLELQHANSRVEMPDLQLSWVPSAW